MLRNLKRVFKSGFTDFSRNKGRSVSAIFVLVITISLVTGIFFFDAMARYIISEVQNKIDITAYFKPDTPEADILNVKNEITQQYPDIKNIQYVSKEDALNNFTEKHKDNPIFSNALTQVGDNPFLPSLNISTGGSALEYQQVADVLQSNKFTNIIDRVDFSDKKAIIEKIFTITAGINNFGLGLTLLLISIAMLIVFNTIKLAIDSSREEISNQRTMGAGSWFVRWPFIIQGAIFGCIAFLICFFITGLLAIFISGGLSSAIPGFSLFDYFISHLFIIILIQFGVGVVLAALTSFIVVQKYLEI